MITNAIVKRIMGVSMIKTPLMSVPYFGSVIHAVIFFLKKLKKNIFFLNSKIIIVHQMVML